MGPGRSLSSGDAPTRWPGRRNVCGAFAANICLGFNFQTAAPRSCSLPPCGLLWGGVADNGSARGNPSCEMASNASEPSYKDTSSPEICAQASPQGERERAAAGASSRRFTQSGATSACPRLCDGCLAIPLVIQDYRPLDEARGFLVPSMLFAPFRPRTSHVMGFGSVLPDRTSPKRVEKIQNRRAQSCPHRVQRKTARRMQTHQSLLSLRQWLSARPRS
jgi:hypothetical protein